MHWAFSSYYGLMKILIDLDCYFVSAQRTIDASLVGKCVAVGGRNDAHIFSCTKSRQSLSLTSSGAFVPSIIQETPSADFFKDPNGKIRGILTTASYEARAKGVKTPMPINQALQLCPELIILPPNFKLYHKLSQELKVYLEERIPLLEQSSIDEFFGDLTGWVADEDVPAFIHNLKIDIMEKFKLPLSIGAAPSKWTAKLATTLAKPFGTKLVSSQEHFDTVKDIDLAKFPGIGAKLQEKFYAMGFSTLADIIHAKEYFHRLTPSMRTLWHRVNGTDNEAVKISKERKSIGVSRTFDPIICRKELRRRLSILVRHLCFTVLQTNVNPTSFHLHIRYETRMSSKGHIRTKQAFSPQLFRSSILGIFDDIDSGNQNHVISFSLSVGAFSHQTRQSLDMFSLDENKKTLALGQSTLEIQQKYGVDSLKWAMEIEKT